MGDMSTCCKSEWGQQHTCSLRKGRYWGPKLHKGFFFLPNCQRKKKSEQGNKGGGFKNYNGRMETKSNAFFGSDRTQGDGRMVTSSTQPSIRRRATFRNSDLWRSPHSLEHDWALLKYRSNRRGGMPALGCRRNCSVPRTCSGRRPEEAWAHVSWLGRG